ncbi:MAG: hypothetical protein GY829_14630 [Gammaproteobacteria bacterium]|nr:hypothetical protein [Gammaproteobacteria bacterium]
MTDIDNDTKLDISKIKEMKPNCITQDDAYSEWLHSKYANDATSEAFTAGYRLGFLAARTKILDQ